ncbi:MAG: pyroglutamyl-peptidase I [Clostridiales bacterium]|nr:pyroglutamyl-peptidase I [Clostridiales bacterium]
MKTILVTAFEPFGGSARNSSLDTLRSLPDKVGTVDLVKVELPVEYDGAARRLAEEIRKTNGLSAVVCMGQAEGRGAITPEYVAVNVRNGSIPDNAGQLCRFAPCEAGGPDGIFATLPVVRLVERLREKEIPASVSFTAGTYVCNSTMYAALRLTAGCGIPAGFVHLPLSAEIAEEEGKAERVPALPQAVLTAGITEILRLLAEG